jgi:hypothetical protein
LNPGQFQVNSKTFYLQCYKCFNPLPHGVLATFSLTAGGPIEPPKKDDIGKEKTILVTSVRTQRASAVKREGLCYIYSPPPPPNHEEVIVYSSLYNTWQPCFYSQISSRLFESKKTF